MTLMMTLLVRDEEDILRENLMFHLEHGVDHIIVTDNMSQDGTIDILSEFLKLGVISVIRETSDTYDQSNWVTRMAGQAFQKGAHWIIHSDADEFWVAQKTVNLKQFFARTFPYNIVSADRHDFVCIEEPPGRFWQRMIYRKALSLNPLGRPLPPKVAHRANPNVMISQGNHDVSGIRWPRVKQHGLEILHFPLRSRKQYVQKIINGGKAYNNNTALPKKTGQTWRSQYAEYLKTGSLQFVEQNILSRSEVERQLAAGELLEDRRLLSFFSTRNV